MDSGSKPPRRRFLNWLFGTSVGALMASVLYPVARFVSPPRIPESSTNQVDAGSADDPIFREQGFKIVRFGTEPVILIKVTDTEFRAFSATCTHLDCIVTFQDDKDRIYCNCHGGVYDLNGRNVAGPPPRPLEPYKVNLVTRGGQPATIVVSKA